MQSLTPPTAAWRRFHRAAAAALALVAGVLSHGAETAVADDEAPSPPAGSEGLVAGVAEVDITPPPELRNWIVGTPYDGVLDPLKVRALYLAWGGERAALMVWDLVDAREPAVARVRAAVAAETGIPEDNILVSATHTHSAPWSPGYGEAAYLTARERGRIGAVASDPHFGPWAEALPLRCAQAVAEAVRGAQPASLAIGRARVGRWLFNRRPIREDGGVRTLFQPEDPDSLPDGLRFGPVDPTLTVVVVERRTRVGVVGENGNGGGDPGGGPAAILATAGHLACHPVSVYPFHQGISADWPGAVAERIGRAGGGVGLVFQGCGGDIVPARRGLEQREQMAAFIASRASAAVARRHPLAAGPLRVGRRALDLPLTPEAAADLGREVLRTEVQAIRVGSLAWLTLPGEPLSGLSRSIQEGSPFPHTLVLGYANGHGTHYVGVPGERARGGYEMGPVNLGQDSCGALLVEAALELLHELAGAG